MALSRSLSLTLVLLLGASRGVMAQNLPDQSFEMRPDSGRFTVGDPVTLRFRLRLDERDLLYDTIPDPPDPLPDGVRVLAIDKLQRGADRIYRGTARVAFYRPGRQPVPLFSLPFMRAVKGVTRGTITTDSAWVEIVPLVSGGSATLRDIREPVPVPGPGPLTIAAAITILAALLWYLRRRQGRPAAEPEPAPVVAAPIPETPSAYEAALARLEEIEAERWPTRGEVARHYEAVADVLRDYLECAEELPARERTTAELLWALPPRLTEGGLRRRCHEVLGEADLVKFARLRPEPADAAAFVTAARDLLARWQAAGSRCEELDAVR